MSDVIEDAMSKSLQRSSSMKQRLRRGAQQEQEQDAEKKKIPIHAEKGI